MFHHAINPVLFHVGQLDVRWYGVMYVIGIIFCYFFARWYAKAHKIKVTEEQINDIIFYLVLGLIVGGRLFYCIFYDPIFFLKNPVAIIKIWEGGMSFHGGFLLGILLAWLYCRKQKLKFLKMADLFIMPIPVALAFGRLGNFINGELWGKPTNLPWGVYFPQAPDAGTVARHPSQIYEIVKNLIIFGSLLVLSKSKSRKDGFLFFSFMLFYGVFRIIIEFFRSPEIVIAGISMGQWLSIPLVIAGVIGIAKTWKR